MKKILTTVAVLVAVVLLACCGGGLGAPAKSETQKAAEKAADHKQGIQGYVRGQKGESGARRFIR